MLNLREPSFEALSPIRVPQSPSPGPRYRNAARLLVIIQRPGHLRRHQRYRADYHQHQSESHMNAFLSGLTLQHTQYTYYCCLRAHFPHFLQYPVTICCTAQNKTLGPSPPWDPECVSRPVVAGYKQLWDSIWADTHNGARHQHSVSLPDGC